MMTRKEPIKRSADEDEEKPHTADGAKAIHTSKYMLLLLPVVVGEAPLLR
jgi:hypothetical protein